MMRYRPRNGSSRLTRGLPMAFFSFKHHTRVLRSAPRVDEDVLESIQEVRAADVAVVAAVERPEGRPKVRIVPASATTTHEALSEGRIFSSTLSAISST